MHTQKWNHSNKPEDCPENEPPVPVPDPVPPVPVIDPPVPVPDPPVPVPVMVPVPVPVPVIVPVPDPVPVPVIVPLLAEKQNFHFLKRFGNVKINFLKLLMVVYIVYNVLQSESNFILDNSIDYT